MNRKKIFKGYFISEFILYMYMFCYYCYILVGFYNMFLSEEIERRVVWVYFFRYVCFLEG